MWPSSQSICNRKAVELSKPAIATNKGVAVAAQFVPLNSKSTDQF